MNFKGEFVYYNFLEKMRFFEPEIESDAIHSSFSPKTKTNNKFASIDIIKIYLSLHQVSPSKFHNFIKR